jgi:uncharacterized membrane protein
VPQEKQLPVHAVPSIMEEMVKSITTALARGVEIAAAVVIGIASVRAILMFLGNYFKKVSSDKVSIEDIRLSLGRSLALALEFLLGADILKTAVAPTWNEIGQLAAIAVLRTALNFFLDRELRNNEAGRSGRLSD